jgi:hypothetical protein
VGSIIRYYSPFSNFLKVQDDLLLGDIHMDSTRSLAAPTVLYTNVASLAAKPPSFTPSHPPHGGNSGNRTKYNNKTAIAVMAAATMARTTLVAEAVVALLGRPPPHWFRRSEQCIVANLRPPVVGAHDFVPWPRARWTAASVGLRGHTGPLRVSRPPVQATAAAAAAIPGSHPSPRMEPLTQHKLGLAIASQLFQHHGAPPASYLGLRLGGELQRDAPYQSISW